MSLIFNFPKALAEAKYLNVDVETLLRREFHWQKLEDDKFK